MHTTTIDTTEIQGIQRAVVHHNGDWSGEATICWSGDDGSENEVKVPGELLHLVMWDTTKEFFQSRLIGFLEDL